MKAYLARQPIFDQYYGVVGYELLYRDSEDAKAANVQDDDAATRRLLSDAITVFGLKSLTGSKPAFVNFSDRLILNDFVRLAKPEQIVVEVLERASISDMLVQRIEKLKKEGYSFALDDYAESERFEKILPFMDIVKVDFRQTDENGQARIAKRINQSKGCRLLAEKVETVEEFKRARSLGYRLFQGRFFEQPVTLKKAVPPLSFITFSRLMNELQVPEDRVDFQRCAQIVQSDAVMTYKLMKQAQSLRFYRGNTVRGVTQMLMVMGVQELRRWVLLALARSNNVTRTDELVRNAYLRGCFSARLIKNSSHTGSGEHAFLTGMFSLMPKIVGLTMPQIVDEVNLPDEVAQALLGRTENWYSQLLRFLDAYEMRAEDTALSDLNLGVAPGQLIELYCQSLAEADAAFS